MSRAATPADVIAGRARWCVVEGDALDVVASLPAACLDAVLTDPPSGIAFMGAEWDRDKGGRAQWVAWLAAILGHARAATRDGGRSLVWSLPRTSHWTGCAVEDAGWSIESTVTHLFGTGWPKGKSQLKPAAETWWLARTGRSEALNIEACRVGAGRRVDPPTGGKGTTYDHGLKTAAQGAQPRACDGRYPPNVVLSHSPGCVLTGTRKVRRDGGSPDGVKRPKGLGYGSSAAGAVTFGHVDPDGTETVNAWECVEGCPVRELDAQSGERPSGAMAAGTPRRNLGSYSGGFSPTHGTPHEIEASAGGASRFFPQFPADLDALFGYHAKPSRAERDAGVSLEAEVVDRYGSMGQGPLPQQTPRAASVQGNNHPTVKSVALMRWLVRLVASRNAVILDPFGGSGTTGVAALAEGCRVILVERDPRFAEIARQRCEHVTPDLAAPLRPATAREPAAIDHGPLFGGTR